MRKRIKQILIIILALCTFLCVPSTVYASTEVVTPESSSIQTTAGGSSFANPYEAQLGTYKNFYSYSLYLSASFSASKGNILILDVKLNNQVYFDMNCVLFTCGGSNSTSSVQYIADSVTYENNVITAAFIITQDFDVFGFTFGVYGLAHPESYKYSCNDNTPFKISISSIECSKTTESQSMLNKLKDWFNNLFQWLKDIRDNATEGFANIGKWFTDLGNNIKTWFNNLTDSISGFFTELKNNLTEWFKNVGDWFTELGDSIGDFFTNIWNNISDSISNITTSVQNWWQGIVDWFNNLFKVPEGYFDAYFERWNDWLYDHLGFVYQGVTFISDFFGLLYDGIKNGKANSIISIPSIVLPFNNLTLVEGTTFDLGSFINGNSVLNNIYRLMQTFVSVIMLFALILYSKKTFYKLLGSEVE